MNFLDGLVYKCHVGYLVNDVDEAIKALKDKLNCALETKSYLFAPEKAWVCDKPVDGIVLKIALCQIKENMTFEYIQPVTEVGYHYLAFMGNGESLNHVSFATDDFDRYRAEFKAMGASFLFEAVANDRLNGYRRCFYAKLPGIPGIMEIHENAKPFRE